MPLSKFKKSNKIEAIKKFTDREKPQDIFKENIDNFVKNFNFFKIITFYGVGGIGKTTLLKKLINNVSNKFNEENVRLHFYSLDAYEYNTPVDVLLSIRNSLKVNCEIFDYSILKYWVLLGHSTKDIENKIIADNSIIWDILGTLAFLGGTFIPNNLLKKAIEKIKQKYHHFFSKFKNIINEIDNYNITEIEERLPFYLGQCINYSIKNDSLKHVFVIDSFESVFKKFKSLSIRTTPDEWLKEFIAGCEIGLFIIASREYLKWGEKNKEWDLYIDQHILGTLTEKDSNYFLKSVPIEDKNIRTEIIKLSKGLPLYLDLCVNIYISKISNNNMVTSEDFNISEDKLVETFLSHLSDPEQEILKIIANLSFFDFGLVSFLAKSFNIGFPITKFSELTNMSLIALIDEDLSFYKMHDFVSKTISKNIEDSLKHSIGIYTLKYFSQNKKNNYSLITLSKLYPHMLNTFIERYNLEVTIYFMDITFFLFDNGYWSECGKNLYCVTTNNKIQENIIIFFKAVYTRRTGNLNHSFSIINKIDLSRKVFGDYLEIVQFSKANIVRLVGNYSQAEVLYKNLLNISINHKYKIKILRQYADLIFLQGRFINSIENLKYILSENYDIIEQAETYRIIGHIYRFNLLFDKAEEYYLKSLTIAENNDSIGLIGKLYTNLTELYCWYNINKSIKYFELSIEINKELEANIELGKTYAAISIAKLIENDINESIQYFKISKSLQKKTGYKSGLIFSELSNLFIQIALKSKKIHSCSIEIQNSINELGVYQFLLLPIFLYFGKQKELNNLKNEIEWINFNRTKKEFNKVLNTLSTLKQIPLNKRAHNQQEEK